MLNLDDPKWEEFYGGYKTTYNASIPLRKLKNASRSEEIADLIDELHEELHHQGDVGLASYYSVPHLINSALQKTDNSINIISLIITIELARHSNNPKIPKDLEKDYRDAILNLGNLGISLIEGNWNLEVGTTSLAAIALSKGQIELAKAITILEDPSTLLEFIETY